MSEHKERSAIFKFFYVILSIITFPIFFILFILRHPLWILFVLFVIIAGAAYYPMSQGVSVDQIVEWYKTKYNDAKVEMVSKAKEQGMLEFVPQDIKEDVKNMEDEALDASIEKGENYNKAIARDDDYEQEKAQLKKRRGFKSRPVQKEKTEEMIPREESVSDNEVQILNQEKGAAGGLSAIIGRIDSSQKDVAEQTQNEESQSETGEVQNPDTTEEVPAESEMLEEKEEQASSQEDELDLF